MIRSACIVFFLLFFFINSSKSQPGYPPPAGIYCSCPPSNNTGSSSVMAAVATKAYVKGILVRVSWKDMEGVDDTYNWSLIDNQLTLARSYNKKVSLAVGGGPNTPAWLYALGVDTIHYNLPFSGSIPVPWNSIFLDKWTSFISKLGNRYKNDTTIQLVYITNASTNGFEMQLPFNPVPSYTSIGYSEQKVIDSWKRVMDTFNTAFPNHYLTNDFHPVNSSNLIADSLYAYGKNAIGNRYGANGWWFTQNNTSVYAPQYAILQNAGIDNRFSGIQMAYSGTASPGSFGTGGLPAALQLTSANNICYCEVWNSDITNGGFDSLFASFNCAALTDTAIWTGSISNNWHTPGNWNINKIPTVNTHVIVPGNTPNECLLTAADGFAHSIDVITGGNFTVFANRKLYLKK
jgi:hypothetical protein